MSNADPQEPGRPDPTAATDPTAPQRPTPTFGRPPAAPDFPAPTGEPAQPPPSRTRPQAGTIAIVALLVFALIGTAVAPLISPAVERFWEQHRPQARPSDPIDPGDRDEGGSGVGDPYFPDAGNGGYDAKAYAVDLTWSDRPAPTPAPGAPTQSERRRLFGTTMITATATQRLRSFFVDLALPVSYVHVNGEVAEFEREGPTNVKITPSTPIRDGDRFRVGISYGGDPAAHRSGRRAPWWESGDEYLVAGEPEAAAWWFPSNDHPSDRARMDVSVEVDEGIEVISNGRLVSADTTPGDGSDTWHWASDAPMAPYLAFIAIGQYEIRRGRVDGRPYLYAVSEQLGDRRRENAFAQLERTPKIIERLEKEFGAYPFTQIGGMVPAHDLWFAGLENQTRPIYNAEAITGGDATDLLVHELAHMWFGDKITLAEWNDIFLNEAYASYAEWLLTERNGGRSAQQQLVDRYDSLAGNRRFWQTTMIDPGRDQLFSTVYVRGPMTLQALRNVLGDEAFFRFARDWADRSGPHSLEQWMRAAQDYTATDLDPFFDAWIRSPEAPARTEANGLG